MPIEDKDRGRSRRIGSIIENQLQLLIGHLEEEWPEDTD